MWSRNSGTFSGPLPQWVFTVGIPPLIVSTLLAAFLFVHANTSTALAGSFTALGAELIKNPSAVFHDAFLVHVTPEKLARAGKVTGAFVAWQLALMRLLPGKTERGPLTAGGNVPSYKANGMQAYFLTIAAFLGFSTWGVGAYLPTWAQYSPSVWMSAGLYSTFICMMAPVAFAFCIALLVKGHVAPSSNDSGSSGSVITDFFWGTELYPRVLGWDVKMFTNCRFGMMLWAVLPISFAAALEEAGVPLQGAYGVNLVLQLVYVAKFFWWEMGYMRTIDIMHDRAGYYICWGCLVWVPSLYVSHSYYLACALLRAKAAGTLAAWELPPAVAAFYLIAGFACIFINYDADRQRAYVRTNDGKVTVWGRPAEVIEAFYEAEDASGKAGRPGAKPVTVKHRSLLVVSGWWGVARHFHYLPEILAALFWTLPATPLSQFTLSGFTFMPYSYVSFLIILLVHRAMRDDVRMADKYGKYYEEYKRRVPYKIVPGIF